MTYRKILDIKIGFRLHCRQLFSRRRKYCVLSNVKRSFEIRFLEQHIEVHPFENLVLIKVKKNGFENMTGLHFTVILKSMSVLYGIFYIDIMRILLKFGFNWMFITLSCKCIAKIEINN